MELMNMDRGSVRLPPMRRRTPAADWARVVIVMVAALSALGCTRTGGQRVAMSAAMMATAGRSQESPNTLSREHSVVIDVPESGLEERFRRVAEQCIADSAHHCTILQSDLSTGDSPAGHIRLRIDPTAVEALIGFAASQGRLEHRSTTVEDLAEAIQDTQSRLEMLTNYRKQLLELQAKAGTNIDAAIKVASELSTVQSNLERVAGEVAYQTKRTTTDVVTIDFIVGPHSAYWRPIRESLRDFWSNFATGVGETITAVAYIVPWLFVAIPGLYLAGLLWRRRGR